jgi:hypothetical protein
MALARCLQASRSNAPLWNGGITILNALKNK